MYDFYPEWGPARNRDEHEATPQRRRRYWQQPEVAHHRAPAMASAAGPEARDGEFQRPDDN